MIDILIYSVSLRANISIIASEKGVSKLDEKIENLEYIYKHNVG